MAAAAQHPSRDKAGAWHYLARSHYWRPAACGAIHFDGFRP
ncbi:protein of unknown function [Azospirillum baldaniorum]|uniref:Uncharacterized protein n=1 Tax=Azospirillum baldaniorum TaxID=1064539 RepID=A0A9P1NMH1_9PROT|nr:protein of unknown function [Azospirillum baldaniorum]